MYIYIYTFFTEMFICVYTYIPDMPVKAPTGTLRGFEIPIASESLMRP